MTEQLFELKARLTYVDEYTHDQSEIHFTLSDFIVDTDDFFENDITDEFEYLGEEKIKKFIQQKIFQWVPLDQLRKEVKKSRYHTNATIEFYYIDEGYYYNSLVTYNVMIDYCKVYENLSEQLQSMSDRKMAYSSSQVAQWLIEIQIEQAFLSLYLRHKDLSTLLEDYIYDLCSLTGDEEVLKEVFAEKYKF